MYRPRLELPRGRSDGVLRRCAKRPDMERLVGVEADGMQPTHHGERDQIETQIPVDDEEVVDLVRVVLAALSPCRRKEHLTSLRPNGLCALDLDAAKASRAVNQQVVSTRLERPGHILSVEHEPRRRNHRCGLCQVLVANG